MRDSIVASVGVAILVLVVGGLVLAVAMQDRAPRDTSHIPVQSLKPFTEIKHDISLKERIRTAQPGEVITLSKLFYGDLEVTGVHFEKPVVIDGKRGAVFKSISLQNVTNLHFKNIRVEAGTAQRQASDLAVNIMRSRHIRFENSDISWQTDEDWTNDGVGMTARLSDDVVITNNNFHHSFIGLVIRDADNIKINDNTFRDIRRDGINVSGTVNIEIDNNLCTNFHPTRPLDHPDCVQFWNDTAIRSNENIRITNNRILRGTGGVSQGIFISGQKEGLHHKNLLIENNVVHQAMGQAIYVQKADEVVVRNNHISAAPPVEFRPMLTVRSPVGNVFLDGNTTPWIDIDRDIPAGLVELQANITTDQVLSR